MSTPNGPIDAIHAECLYLRDQIREHVNGLHDYINIWEPGPMPDDFEQERRQVVSPLPPTEPIRRSKNRG